MLIEIASVVLLAGTAPSQTTLPRHPDPGPAEQRQQREGESTDPWFDRAYAATDDPAFILAAVENARQGVIDARGAQNGVSNPKLRAAADKIVRQNEITSQKLEKLASAKGWRVPQPTPGRTSAVIAKPGAPVRSNADFILAQISFHENTLSHYRAQLSGKGDADLKRALKEAVPGYQKNLELLLTLKP